MPRAAAHAPVTGVSIDTRTLEPGDLFVALKDQRDGHDFVPAAFKAGAAAALVSESYQRQAGDGALFRVADPLKGLEALGRAARGRLDPEARVIAVTGSAGKTGTKEMLRACLAKLGPTHASEKSYNNHWGVPLTLARMPRETRYGVFEIGMNHAGEIRRFDEDGSSARGDHHDGRSCASRALCERRSHRRCQRRNLRRADAGRRRDHQRGQSTCCAAEGHRSRGSVPSL